MPTGFMIENGFMRIRPCRFGLMLYNVNDMYIGRALDLYGEVVREEFNLLAQIVRPGQIVLDLGANIGLHSLFFARAVGTGGRVMAFEPQAFLYNTLCGNLAMNAVLNVRALHAAVGADKGTVKVPVLDPSRVGNFGGLSLDGRESGDDVGLVRVDDLELPACHLMKIDVEGMELDAVKGAGDTIARHNPVLYMENNRADKSAPLIEHLLTLGYRLFWHLPPLFHADNFRGVKKNIFGKIVNVNMLCLPGELSVNVSGLREITDPGEDWRAHGRDLRTRTGLENG